MLIRGFNDYNYGMDSIFCAIHVLNRWNLQCRHSPDEVQWQDEHFNGVNTKCRRHGFKFHREDSVLVQGSQVNVRVVEVTVEVLRLRLSRTYVKVHV